MDHEDNNKPSPNPADQRRSDRKAPDEIVAVMDAFTQQPMGHIGNISDGGLMLISRRNLEAGSLFQISFTLPRSQGDGREFDVGAVCLWCSEASMAGSWWAGFEIMDISDEDSKDLKAILDEL